MQKPIETPTEKKPKSMFASMFGSEPAPKLQGNPKENLKYLVSNFNNSYKSDEVSFFNQGEIKEYRSDLGKGQKLRDVD
jgi:hypothetical protein